ncbi:hypothetical protein GYW21_09630 [Lactobacillus mellis]|nr:hypothetical protein [Bombilactobacillus mellis]
MKAENNELIKSYVDPKLQVRVTKALQKGLESGKAEVVFDEKKAFLMQKYLNYSIYCLA